MRAERKELRKRQQRKIKYAVLIIFLLILVIAVGTTKLLKSSNKSSTNVETIATSNSSTINSGVNKKDTEGRDIRETLNMMLNLYSNVSEKILREDLTLEEVDDVQTSIDKLEDSKMKSELNYQLGAIRDSLSQQ